MEASRDDIVDFIEELVIELYYLAGECGPHSSGAILGFANALDRLADKLARRKPGVLNVGEFA